MDAKDVKTAVVVGAGAMGHSIAQVFAQHGIEVGLVDTNDKVLDRAVALIQSNLNTLAAFKRVTRKEIPTILSRIHPSTDLSSVAHDADFAVETVSEVADVKRKVFMQLDEVCRENTVLSSNTSSLDPFGIADISRPEWLIIAHWFNPAHIVPLVEVMPGPKTSSQVVELTAGLMRRLGKMPIVLEQFVPSGIVSRIQQGMGFAVFEIVDKGWATPEQIDRAVKAVMGIRLPILAVCQLFDFTGLDVVHNIVAGMGFRLPLIEEMVDQGHLGVKTSKGIYDYGERSEQEILRKRDELFLKMLDHLERIKAFDPV
jgi:3-hydroxybutyryl-CoA dehydrogenase